MADFDFGVDGITYFVGNSVENTGPYKHSEIKINFVFDFVCRKERPEHNGDHIFTLEVNSVLIGDVDDVMVQVLENKLI